MPTKSLLEQVFDNCGEQLDRIIEAYQRIPPPNPKTVVTYESGDVEEYEISGQLGSNSIPNIEYVVGIEIGNAVTSIDEYALYDSAWLQSVTIPASVSSIGYEAFANTGPEPMAISVSLKNKVYDSRNGCNAIIRTSDDTLIVGSGNTIIPAGVTSIGEGAFGYCGSLTSIVIPNSVTSIGNSAFECCPLLDSIIIPNSVSSIGYGAFLDCSMMTSVTIGNNVTTIGHDAFGYCGNLTSITIPSNVTSIGQMAFSNCDNLTTFTMQGKTKAQVLAMNNVPWGLPNEGYIICTDGSISVETGE